MELEKAKERCKKLITTKFNNDYSIDSTDQEAIENVLNKLKELNIECAKLIIENQYSISKDKIREKINNDAFEINTYDCGKIDVVAVDILQELLEDK